MSLNQFFQDVGAQLQEFIWRDVPDHGPGEAIDQLERRMRHESAELNRLLNRVDALRARQVEAERRRDWLASRIEIYHHVGDKVNAWQHALELDRLRYTLEGEGHQLHRLRQAYRLQHARLEHLQHQLAELQGLV